MANVFIIIGAGGTGSSVATMISRMYSNSKIHIIDGDKVEKSNVERQAFQQHDIKKFKAESLAIKLNSAGNPTNEHYFINKYLDNPDIINYIIRKTNYGDQVFIIGCVDNHPARMILESLGLKERLYHNSRDLIYIDSANEEWTGEVIKVEFVGEFLPKIKGRLRSSRYPSIKKDKTGKRENVLSCSEIIESGGIQQYSTNSMAANIILQLINSEDTGIVYFDTRKMVMSFVKDKKK